MNDKFLYNNRLKGLYINALAALTIVILSSCNKLIFTKYSNDRVKDTTIASKNNETETNNRLNLKSCTSEKLWKKCKKNKEVIIKLCDQYPELVKIQGYLCYNEWFDFNDIAIDLNSSDEIGFIEQYFMHEGLKEIFILLKNKLKNADYNKKLNDNDEKDDEKQQINESNTNAAIVRLRSNIEQSLHFRFRATYAGKLTNKILKNFDEVIKEEEFDSIEKIKQDVNKGGNNSMISRKLFQDIDSASSEEEHVHDLTINNDEKILIENIFNDIVKGAKMSFFAIEHFTFVVVQRDVIEATELVKNVCTALYTHPDKLLSDEKKAGRANQAEDKSLCVTKAVDLKNGYPILSWLLDSYHQDRVKGHKKLFLHSSMSPTRYPYDTDKYSTGYNVTRWWLDDNYFCKYIQYKNAKIALPMMTAVLALSNRALSQMNFDQKLSPVICDDLNDIVKYVLGSWGFAHVIINGDNDEKSNTHIENNTSTKPNIKLYQSKYAMNSLPIQFDFWIIPQLTKPGKFNSFFDLEELFTDDDDLCENLENYLNENNKNKYNKLGKASSHEKVKYPIWDLEEELQKNNYIKGKDFWVDYVNDDLKTQLLELLNTAKGGSKKYRRYIIIIDRRNPENLRRKNMGYEEPKYDNNKHWKDKLYFIIPKESGIISNQYEQLPEVGLNLSKELLFPSGGTLTEKIGILNEMNGYKFCVSYHLYKSDQVKTYWYRGMGSQKFKLDDMTWLWSRYFTEITNDKCQKLNSKNIQTIKEYQKNKKLHDAKFECFYEQCKKIKLFYH